MTDQTSDSKVLQVVWSPFEPVAHIVATATIAAAEALDASPFFVDFGGLRRSGAIDELESRLEQLGGATLNEYVSAIERCADQRPVGSTIAERLACLVDVEFDGIAAEEFDPEEEVRYLPADDDDCRTDWEVDQGVAEEYGGYNMICKAMSNDIPRDLFDEYCASSYGNSPAFSGLIDDRVDANRIDALISALESRGYTVVRSDQNDDEPT